MTASTSPLPEKIAVPGHVLLPNIEPKSVNGGFQPRRYSVKVGNHRQSIVGATTTLPSIQAGNNGHFTFDAESPKRKASMQPASSEDDRRKEIHRRSIARDRIENRLGRQNRTPSPVAGRSHIDIQTDLYLEELADVIPEADISTQTDSFLDRPASPIFIPKKSGDDVATQIEQGDLFDFDIEVQPLLDIIVGKTLEQAIFEVLEERELAALKSQQRFYEEKRQTELAESLRLEAAEKRRNEEKERRLKEAERRRQEKQLEAEKAAARQFAQDYLKDVVPSVFETMAEHGLFYDKVELDIQKNFLPWLSDQVSSSLREVALARALLDDLLIHILNVRTRTSPAQ